MKLEQWDEPARGEHKVLFSNIFVFVDGLWIVLERGNRNGVGAE